MSERGVFAVDRGIFNHPVFADEPLTEREAWQWLIAEAAWRERAKRVGSVVVKLKRGQLAASVRFMAEAWGWSKSRVGRFLDRLKIETMVSTDNGTGVLVITICNYDKYQRVSLPTGTESGTQTGTAAGQQRDKLEDIKNIELDDDGGALAPLVSREAINLANEVALVCGHDPEFVPPEWMGAAWTTQKWLNGGWNAAAILAACKETMARKRDGPPTRIEYFEKAIAKFIARQAAPLPQVEIVKGETLHVVQGFGQQNQRGSLTDAARRLAASFAEDRPGESSPAGGNLIRMLPPGRRE
jgi:hypothetical protein